jgi:hypothetical protein
VVVINNTPDPAQWQPVEEHCRTLGDRFKFVQIDKLVGYKAGALRLALAHTAPDAEIIAIIDADYVVDAAWLKDLVPLFADARVGLIQSPQDHRDGDTSLMHYAMNSEYAGFFDIGMVQRNEVNAIVVHGTMCLIRRAAMENSGGWSSDTIVEDTDLGLSVLEHGWVAHYTNRRYGRGLLPDTFDAYKRQRHRWAFGGFQLLRKHWRQLLPKAQGLTREQKREFAVGWLNWMGADTIGVVVAFLNILYVPFIVYSSSGVAVWLAAYIRSWASYIGESRSDMLAQRAEQLSSFGAVPDHILTLPIIAAFAVTVAHFISLYRLRVRASSAKWLAQCLRQCRCNGRWRARSAPACSKSTCHSCARPRAAWPARAPISPPFGKPGLPACSSPARRRSRRPITSRSTKSISSRRFLWCRACHSWLPSRWPGSRARVSTASPSGAASKPRSLQRSLPRWRSSCRSRKRS